MTMIVFGDRPDRPEGTEALGLTTELWNCLTKCWHENPEERIGISEVLALLNSTWVLPLIQDQLIGMCSQLDPRVRAESVTVGASGSELSIGGVTTSTTVGTKKSTSIRRPPSSAHSHQRSDSRAQPQTGMTSPHSSHHRAGITGVELSEATGGTSVRIKTFALTDKVDNSLAPKPRYHSRRKQR